MATRTFELQGHRGARGLKPENTLPSFEAAIDDGVNSIETDVHLSRDGVPLICHDHVISEKLCRFVPGKEDGAPEPASRPLITALTVDELRCYRADCNPDPGRFPDQDASVTPLARLFADQLGLDPYAPPFLSVFLQFVKDYSGEVGVDLEAAQDVQDLVDELRCHQETKPALGTLAGKTEWQRDWAKKLRFDLELKRVPFRPEWIGDPFDGLRAGALEESVLYYLNMFGVLERTRIRSFDHRSVKIMRQLEPRLEGAVLIAGTAPVDPVQLVRGADAQVYCPEFEFLDEAQVRRLHAEGIRVLPWTVNEQEDWQRLIDWGIDGITTDYPDRLAKYLLERGIPF